MTFCLTCNAEKYPIQKFTANGMVDACPQCESVFARLDPEAQPVVTTPLEVLPLSAARPAGKSTPKGEPECGDTLIERLRARLAFVDAEIVTRLKYDGERDRLRRMIAAAADDEPVTLSN